MLNCLRVSISMVKYSFFRLLLKTFFFRRKGLITFTEVFGIYNV